MTEQVGYELFRQWSLYERVVRFNHMCHREMVSALRVATAELRRPLRVLDLGCGAGELAWSGLREALVSEYVGIDLSEDAIAQLQAKAVPGSAESGVQVTGICGDMQAELGRLPDDRFDLILASYSIHHFPGERKVPVLAEIGRVLAPGGAFIWIDLVCAEGETAAEYLARTCERIRGEWNSLSAEEREATCTHALTCDYPETASRMQALLTGHSFARGRLLYGDDFYGGWLFPSSKVGE